MRTVIVTGSAGLIGSETVKRFAKEGAHVVGIDNDIRAQFFGAEASIKRTHDELITKVPVYDHCPRHPGCFRRRKGCFAQSAIPHRWKGSSPPAVKSSSESENQ